MKGGVKLVNSKEGDTSTGIDSILYMMKDSRTVIKPLTFSSLKGFIFSLNVDDNVSKYTTLGASKFDTPVTKFLFKIVIIHFKNDAPLPLFHGLKKSCESSQSFLEEAMLQQELYEHSIEGGRTPICPPVANYTTLNNKNALHFIDYIQNRLQIEERDHEGILEYLKAIFRSPVRMGIIVMPNVINSDKSASMTYERYIDSHLDDIEFSNILVAQTIRLLFMKCFHYDLHSKNSLVTTNPPNVYLIDFGRASNLKNNKADEYNTMVEKRALLHEIKTLSDKEEQIQPRLRTSKPYDKSTFIEECIQFLKTKDKVKNQVMFHLRDKDAYQMDWLEDIQPKEYGNIYDIYQRITEGNASSRSRETIKEWKREGSLFSFEGKTFNDVVPPFPVPPVPAAPVLTMEKSGDQYTFCNGVTCVAVGAAALAAFLYTRGGKKGKRKTKRKYKKNI
jgi:hypothetical protein